MKNVSKKLFSLVLAAVLLLSVVPFQALAAEGDSVVRVFINNNQYTYETSLEQGKIVDHYLIEALVANKIDYQDPQVNVNSVVRYNGTDYVDVDRNNAITEDMFVSGSNVIDLIVDVTLGEPKPEEPKPEEKPEQKPEEVSLFVQVKDRDTNKQITSYSYVVKNGQQWDLVDTQKSLEAQGYGIAYYTVNDQEMGDLYFTVNGDTNVIVYAVKTGDSKPTEPDDEKPVDPKEKTEVIIKVYEHTGNKKVDTIYYTGKRDSYLDLDKVVSGYVLRQYRYEGKSTNSRIKLRGEEMEIVAIMDEDQGDMCTVTLRVHFKNAIQKEVYKFKSGTEIDIGKILVEDDVIESVKEIEKIYLRGIHVNKNNNIVTVKRSGTYDVYTDEKPYDGEDHSYPSYDNDEDLDKNAGKATLKFYLKKDMQKYTKPSAVKTITISNTAALDSKVTLQEVKKLAANYFKAENSEGIDFGDGLYIQEEYDNAKDVWDSTDGVDVFYNVNAMRNDGDVTFFVVLDNVKSVSSGSNADSSNPKTGDSIFVAVTVMAVSSLALGAAYVLNKKRMAR